MLTLSLDDSGSTMKKVLRMYVEFRVRTNVANANGSAGLSVSNDSGLLRASAKSYRCAVRPAGCYVPRRGEQKDINSHAAHDNPHPVTAIPVEGFVYVLSC
jgi:hypothetical protein